MPLTAGTASAPGKVVLAGEYAVLHGAPAIAMAVNRRAQATVAAADCGHLELRMPGFADGRFRFRAGAAGAIDWLDAAPSAAAFRLFECTWRLAAPEPAAGYCVSLDSRPFMDASAGRKLGLGSSAALAVALSALLQPRAQLAAAAQRAHSDFQGGSGSGVDIATAVQGGVLEFRRGDGGMSQGRAWPDGLCAQLFWSGTAVSTPGRIRQLDRQLQDPARQPSLAALCTAAEALAASWSAGSASQVLVQYLAYNAALRAFDRDQGLGIYDGGHEEMHGLAERHQVIYKPSGAGGGDIGVALATDPEALSRFTVAAQSLAFAPLDVELEAAGVELNGRQI